MTNQTTVRNAPVTVDKLLEQKRTQRPSVAAMNAFERSFPRKLMAAVAKPRKSGRALKVAGWVTPFVFGSAAAVALVVAYFASPARAIARWEAQTTRKDYVVDNLTAANHSWKVEHGLDSLSSVGGSAAADANAIATASGSGF